jgi:hypothetical protein
MKNIAVTLVGGGGGAAAATTMDKLSDSAVGGPSESVTLTVKLVVPEAVGTPPISAAVKLNPAGRLPAETLHV